MVKAELKVINGGPTVVIDGKPVCPMLNSATPLPWDGELPISEKEFMQKYFDPHRQAGLHLYHFGVDLADHFGARQAREGAITDIRDRRKVTGVVHFETKDVYSEDFSRLDKQLEWLRNYDPEALVLLRVHCEFHLNRYWWWRQQNPRELEVLANGTVENQSLASKKWLDDTTSYLGSLVKHLRSTELGQTVFGFLVGGGASAEWVKDFAMENYGADYSELMRGVFTTWLWRKYGSMNALRKAWRDPYAHFGRIEVPTPEEQTNADVYQFRDPGLSRKVIDYFEFLSDLTADDITHLCKAVKDASNNELLAGVFYGYLLGLTWCNWFFDQNVNNKTTAYQRSGHLALGKVLSSPYVDFICSPIDYGFRGIGGDSSPMPLMESIRLHGKLYFFEDDTRTHLFPPNSMYGMARNTKEMLAILTRNFGRLVTSSSGCWYCSWTEPRKDRPGPYQDPAIVERMTELVKACEKSLGLDRSPAGEIAVVLDEKSFLYESMRRNFDFPQVFLQKLFSLPRIGAPFDTYLLSDIERMPDQYKCYIFLNAVHMSEEERDQVRKVVRRNGKVSVWLYGSGMIDDYGISAENMEDVTGMRFTLDYTEWGLRLLVTNFEHPITKELPANTSFGTDLDLGPVPYVSDSSVTELGTLVYSRGMCVPGMAVKELSDWRSVYIGAPNVPSNVFKSIAQYAGVHIFSHSDDVLYASRNFVSLHTTKAGAKMIYLPQPSYVYDVIRGRLLASDKSEFTDVLNACETKLYYYGQRHWE